MNLRNKMLDVVLYKKDKKWDGWFLGVVLNPKKRVRLVLVDNISIMSKANK